MGRRGGGSGGGRYRKAAEQNDVDAQFNLGHVLRRGRPGDGGLAEVYKWLSLAAMQGHEGAKKFMTVLESKLMTPEQIAQGQKRAREFKPPLGAVTIFIIGLVSPRVCYRIAAFVTGAFPFRVDWVASSRLALVATFSNPRFSSSFEAAPRRMEVWKSSIAWCKSAIRDCRSCEAFAR